jgi:DNA primase
MSVSLTKDELKELLCSPLDVAEVLGLSPRRAGDGAQVSCPWHSERNPSCSLFVGSDGFLRAHCHACGAGGDVFSLIAQLHGLDVRADFRAVLEQARVIVGDAAVSVARGTAGAARSRAQRPHRHETDLSAERYHRIAWEWLSLCSEFQYCSPARAYLAERGLLEQADAAGLLGLPDGEVEERSVVARLHGTRDSRRFSVDELDAAGIIQLGGRSSYAFRWPQHFVLIPWVSEGGAITAVQQRYVGPSEPPNKYIWPPGRAAHQPFGIEDLRNHPAVDVVIVEGALDVLARRELARRHGENIDVIGIASAGTPVAGLPLEKLLGRRVRISVDRDEAGERAASALFHAVAGHAREVVREVPPALGAKDWNDQLWSANASGRGTT